MENENRDDYVGFTNQIKLAIFNIIASQEARLSRLADYLNSQPQDVNNEQLIDLYNKQRGAVSSLTLVTNDLSNVLSQIDYNDRVISELIVNANQNVSNNETEYSDIPQQDVSYEEPQNVGEEVSGLDESVENTSSAETELSSDVGFIETPTDPEPNMEISNENTEISSEADNIVETTDDIVSSDVVQETSSTEESAEQVESSSEIVETTDDIVPEESAVENSVVDNEEKSSEVVETSNEVVPLESEQKDDEETEKVDSNTTENQDDLIDTTSNDEKSDDVVAETSELSDETSKDVDINKESDGNPIIVDAPVVEKTDESDEKNSDIKDVAPAIEEKPTDNVIQIKAESLDSGDDVNEAPLAALSDEKVDDSSETTIDFVAIDPNFSRAILINRKQATNLRKSLLKQTESFNTFSVKNKGSNDIKITADNLEEMLEKATSLYSEEKVEEAEQLMQKIDEFRSTQVIATR